MRIAVLANSLKHWQHRALEAIAKDHELLLLSCPERPQRRSLRHAGYYLLNLAAIRNSATRRVPSTIVFADRIDFEAEHEGAWASLPRHVLDWCADRQVDAIVKFGLGLLRVPDGLPVLSFHHGDPSKYRGRPAGFYEILNRDPYQGQIVQVLGPKLDGGKVLAFGETRIFPHSYRKTLTQAYSLSPSLLPKALDALRDGREIPIKPEGRNYRLPSNATVARFAAGCAAASVRRIGYGLLTEKRWNIATVDAAEESPLAAIAKADDAAWQIRPIKPPHTFYADPFFHGDDILLEALNAKTGKGELVRLPDGQRISGFAGHVSYPSEFEGFVIPEMAGWSAPGIYRIEGAHAIEVAPLDVGTDRILDPTLVRHGERIYLFGNRKADGPGVLSLWSASDLFGRFEPHPATPVHIRLRGGRMAGPILYSDGKMFRLGQDFRQGYGDGILIFRIDALTPLTYREEQVGEISFARARGPHTLSYRNGKLLFDWYTERLSPMAGVRRLLGRL